MKPGGLPNVLRVIRPFHAQSIGLHSQARELLSSSHLNHSPVDSGFLWSFRSAPLPGLLEAKQSNLTSNRIADENSSIMDSRDRNKDVDGVHVADGGVPFCLRRRCLGGGRAGT